MWLSNTSRLTRARSNPWDSLSPFQGTVVDGHDFIDQAIASGAACVICERMPEETPEHVTVIQVKSSANALGHVAAAFHDHPSAT